VKDETARPQSDMDVLKFYIWLMVVMTLMLAGIFWWLVWVKLDETQKNLAHGTAWMKDFAQQQSEIQAMLNVHRNNKEDIARDAPQTWFSSIWRRKGINDASMAPGSWKVPPSFNAKGKFYEEQIDMKFNPRAPLPRQSIAEFCHEVEKSSTRLRIIELTVNRASKDDFDKDEWGGTATIGYRHARQD
jgi:hypothetical protein